MKIAAAEALAELARRDVPDEVDAAYSCLRLHYGREYIIPAPFDPRLIVHVSSAVAQAAMDSGVARRPIENMAAYRAALGARLDPSAAHCSIHGVVSRSEEHTSELQSLMRISYAVFCLKKNKHQNHINN